MWELINAKLEHRKPAIVTEEPGTAKVINIMDALKKSVKAQGKQAAPSKASKASAPPHRARRQEGLARHAERKSA